MKKRISTFLACVLFAGFAQAQVLFDPADFAEGDSVGSGKIVLLDNTKYLQVVLNGWNSRYTLPEVVKTINCAGIEATFKFAMGNSSIAEGWGINAAVQANDLLVADQVGASWDPTQMVNSICSASTASTAAANFVTVRGSFDENVMTQINELQFFGQETTNYGPTTGDTLWVGVVKLVYAPGILFEPQNASIGTLVTIGDEYYRQIVLDGWNSAVDIATVSTSGYAGLQAKIMASAFTTIPEGKTINFNVQANDTLKADQVEASWDATQTVNITCGAGTAYESCKELVEVSNNFSNKALTEIHQIQFSGQNTWNWAPVSGDTLYVSTVTLKSALTDDPTVVFDPADYELEDYTDEIYEIVEVDGAKYMKVVTDGTWDQVVDINEWFNVGEYNKVKGSLIVRNSSTYADDAVNGSAQFMTNGSSAGFFTGYSVGTNQVTGDYNSGDVVNQIQFFGQNTDDWNSITNIEIYIGKITAYYEQPDTADAPVWADAFEVFIGSNSVYAEGRETDNCVFIPTHSGEYIFYTEGSSDTYGYLLDADKNQLTYNDDGGSGNNFRMTYNLTAGSTYYIGAGYYSDNSSGYITLVIDTEMPFINATALNGTVSGGGTYPLGDTITLTVTPNDDYTFAQWSDGNTDNPRTVIVAGDLQLVAYCLTDGQSLIPITILADENGSAAGGGIYMTDATATLTATPNEGYHFVRWSDGNTDNPRNYIVTGNTTLTAVFAPNRYYITGTGGGSGITVTTAGIPNPEGTKAGEIWRWESNNPDGPFAELQVPEDGVYNLQTYANDYNDWDSQFFFVISDDTLSAGTPVSIYFEYASDGDSVVFNAQEHGDPHYYLDWKGWDKLTARVGEWQTYTDEAFEISKSGVRTFAVNASIARTAATLLMRNIRIEVNYETVIETVKTTETYSAVTGYGTYNYGDTATLTATPSTGYHFVRWSDGNTDNPRSYIVTGNTTLTAVFALNEYNVSASANNTDFGYVFIENQTVTHGDSTLFIAAAKKGYRFINWSDGNTDVLRNLTITRNTDLIANFAAIPQSTTIHDTLYKDVKIVSIHDTIYITKADTIYITNTDTIYLQTAINAKAINNLNIYPNPTTQFVTVDADKEFSYTLTNTAGKVLRKEENAASYLIDLSEFKSSIYLLTTSDGVTYKIVKQ